MSTINYTKYKKNSNVYALECNNKIIGEISKSHKGWYGEYKGKNIMTNNGILYFRLLKDIKNTIEYM